jgi:hypothetical protein
MIDSVSTPTNTFGKEQSNYCHFFAKKQEVFYKQTKFEKNQGNMFKYKNG